MDDLESFQRRTLGWVHAACPNQRLTASMRAVVAGAGVVLDEVSKRFGATQALDRVSLEIEPGEIHALVGENGAGKSTLGKIIGGEYIPDSGVLRVDGEAVSRWNPSSALALGIATIQQELSLVPALSVAENVFLGIERSRFGVLFGSVMERYEELDDHIGFGIAGDTLVNSLRLADQQKVEVMRALARDARLIVLDEPTSSLTKDEADRLHEIMRTLKGEGRTLVYVSHFLGEVLSVADRVTIMRDGVITRTGPTSNETIDSLVEGMLGRSMEVNFPAVRPVDPDTDVVFEARQISGDIPNRVSLHVRSGEILGIAGLLGSGRTELARLICGADPLSHGEMLLDGERLPKLSVHNAISRGITMLPEDRRSLGLVMTQNVRENITLPSLGGFSRRGRIKLKEERGAVHRAIERMNIVPPLVDGALQFYSGGNQQKTLFAKWTLKKPRLLVLDEPTRGVDVGAKRNIYDAIINVANEGTAVIFISSELEEVVHMSHRVMIMSEGRVVRTVNRGECTVDEILALLFTPTALNGEPNGNG